MARKAELEVFGQVVRGKWARSHGWFLSPEIYKNKLDIHQGFGGRVPSSSSHVEAAPSVSGKLKLLKKGSCSLVFDSLGLPLICLPLLLSVTWSSDVFSTFLHCAAGRDQLYPVHHSFLLALLLLPHSCFVSCFFPLELHPSNSILGEIYPSTPRKFFFCSGAPLLRQLSQVFCANTVTKKQTNKQTKKTNQKNLQKREEKKKRSRVF